MRGAAPHNPPKTVVRLSRLERRHKRQPAPFLRFGNASVTTKLISPDTVLMQKPAQHLRKQPSDNDCKIHQSPPNHKTFRFKQSVRKSYFQNRKFTPRHLVGVPGSAFRPPLCSSKELCQRSGSRVTETPFCLTSSRPATSCQHSKPYQKTVNHPLTFCETKVNIPNPLPLKKLPTKNFYASCLTLYYPPIKKGDPAAGRAGIRIFPGCWPGCVTSPADAFACATWGRARPDISYRTRRRAVRAG